MSTNANQFARELAAETQKVTDDEFIAFRADLVGDALAIAESRTPRKTGDMAESWGIRLASRHGKPLTILGSERARARLHKAKVGSKIAMGNEDFKASWHEHGTVKMRARPMLRPALEAVKDRVR